MRAAVGYQPVGMNPVTRLRASEISATATTFASEQATYNFVCSGFSARPLGVMPSGWRGVSATLMDSSTFMSVAVQPDNEHAVGIRRRDEQAILRRRRSPPS